MEYATATDFKSVFCNLPGASALVQPDVPNYTVIASTPEFASFAGADPNDLVGKSLFTYFPDNPAAPNVSDDIRASLARCISTQKKNEIVAQRYDIASPDGTFHEMYWTVIHTPILDESDAITSIIHTAVDVTDRVMSQKQEQNVNRLKSLIESAPFPIGLYIGRDMRIEMVNQAILQVWGKQENVIGKTYSEVLPELEGQGPYEQLDHVFMTGESFHATNRRVDLEIGGELKIHYFNYSFTPLFDNAGKIYGVMNTAADVTDLNVAKKAVEASEANFRAMIQQAPVAVGILNATDFTFGIINPMMEALLGKSSRELEGRSLEGVFPDGQGAALQLILKSVAETGTSYISDEQEFDLKRHEPSETVHVRYIYEPMSDAAGKIEGIMIVATDITQQVLARRKIEEIVSIRTRELAEANQRLQRSNSELEQFAFVASHDLQEPLRKITLFLQMLESNLGKLDERSSYQMERINNAVDRMRNLIHDILGYSQLSGKKETFKSTDLQKVFVETMVDFDLIVEEKHGSIIAENLPVIDAIPLQMAQLFNNLISNALKYSRDDIAPMILITSSQLPETEILELGLTPRGATGYAKIVFKDNGIGFPQEYADKIFNIFQRLHGKTQYEGTGIGLAMCKKIVENHHGVIYAAGSENNGAEFTVILPRSR